MKITSTLALALAVSFASVSGCGKKDESGDEETETAKAGEGATTQEAEPKEPKEPEGPPPVEAKMKDREGNDAGTVWFSQRKDVVTILVDIKNLPPGFHGMQIMETGDCSAEDFSSAGEPFNPTDSQHGAPDSDTHMAGDLGNIAVGAKGVAEKKMGSTEITVGTEDNGIAGRAVIIFEKKADLRTHPSGDAGERIACGVIEQADG